MKRKPGRPKKFKVSENQKEGGEKAMPTGQDVIDAIAAQKTVVGGLKVYIADLHKKLDDALAANGGVLTQAQVNQIFTDIGANTQTAADSMVQGTGGP